MLITNLKPSLTINLLQTIFIKLFKLHYALFNAWNTKKITIYTVYNNNIKFRLKTLKCSFLNSIVVLKLQILHVFVKYLYNLSKLSNN